MWRDSLESILGASYSKPLIFAFCSTPAIVLTWGGVRSGLDPEFTEAAVRHTGEWTLKLLILTLAVTPLRRLTGLSSLIQFRRMLGLFAFSYGCLHVLAWQLTHHLPGVAQFKAWNLRLAFLALVLMIPLAVTSTAGSIQRLGSRRWRMLHTLIYVSTILGYVHYCGIGKSGMAKATTVGGILAVLLILRFLPIKNS